MLEKELQYFKKIQNELQLKHSHGGFAVIKNEVLLGVWKNRSDALKEGIEEYGLTPFLVKNINDDIGKTINFTRDLEFNNAIYHI
jgi:hypothetical protein